MRYLKNYLPLVIIPLAIIISACGGSSNESEVANEQTETAPLAETTTETEQEEQPVQSEEQLANKPEPKAKEVSEQPKTEVNATPQTFQGQLNKAKTDGKPAFIVVTEEGVEDTDMAIAMAEEAKAINGNAVVLQLRRDDQANAQYVNEWQLSGAPLPLILVVSSQGNLAGGFILNRANPEALAALVPSPKLEEVQMALANEQPAFVVFTSKSISDRDEVLSICSKASDMLNPKAKIIEVDLNDGKETNFINQLRISKDSEESVTVVINVHGQISGISPTVPDAAKLAEAATQIVQGGCAGGPAGCAR